MIKILQYNLLNLKRFKMAKYQIFPEYYGLILTVALFTIIILGVASEEVIMYDTKNYLNFNIVALFFLVGPICCDVFMYSFYDVNYRYFKLLYPFKSFKIVVVDVLLELLSYKLFFIFFFLISYIPFCITYDLTFFNEEATIGFILILSMYVNTCLITRLIKELGKNKILGAYKNYLKLIFILLFVMLVVNENSKTFSLNCFRTTTVFFFISVVITILIMSLLYLINIKNDKI